MRLRIAHSTVYRYDPPATGVIQVLRLTPRNHDGQYVMRWRIDVDADTRLAAHEDAFGNLTHVFSADGPFDTLRVEVDGEAETQNNDGVVRGAVERFPPTLFLRDTAATQADGAMRDLAQGIRAAGSGNILGVLHELLARLHEDVVHEPEGEPTTAAAAFTHQRGTTQDMVHAFIGVARVLDIPARFVSGYRAPDGALEPHGTHAWAEACIPSLGWVGFDPVIGACPTDAYVRVAVGLDAVGAAPVRGTRYGQGAQILETAIKVDQ
jgi:transglutaminase-like putative cysteine protease